jgi:hypothetical protein
MTVRRITCLALSVLGITLSTAAQTAHDYFKELKDANAFNHYNDEYVCFRDDDVPSFDVVAKVSTVIDILKGTDNPVAKDMLPYKNDILVQTYTKGVALGKAEVYEHVAKTDSDYELVFMKPMHGRIVFSFNWLTGRYRWTLYDLDHNKDVATHDRSGKCELIH